MRGLSPNWLLGTETLHLYIRRDVYKRQIVYSTGIHQGEHLVVEYLPHSKYGIVKELSLIHISRLSIRFLPPYSEERRQKASEYAKKHGLNSQQG